MKADREIVLAAIKQNRDAIQHASMELQDDWEVQVTANGMRLCEAPEEVKRDRSIVMAAIQQNGRALEHASAELKADREIVLAAVQDSFSALRHASDEMRSDETVVVASINTQLRKFPRDKGNITELKQYALSGVPEKMLQSSTVRKAAGI